MDRSGTARSVRTLIVVLIGLLSLPSSGPARARADAGKQTHVPEANTQVGYRAWLATGVVDCERARGVYLPDPINLPHCVVPTQSVEWGDRLSIYLMVEVLDGAPRNFYASWKVVDPNGNIIASSDRALVWERPGRHRRFDSRSIAECDVKPSWSEGWYTVDVDLDAGPGGPTATLHADVSVHCM